MGTFLLSFQGDTIKEFQQHLNRERKKKNEEEEVPRSFWSKVSFVNLRVLSG
jgi:hypothetical protein